MNGVVVLGADAEEVADRVGVKVRLELEPGVTVTPTTQAALLRIVREAVTNAAVHGRPREIAVRVVASPRLRVSVSDDGIGFDPEKVNGHGFGLVSMRERAGRLGGTLDIESSPGQGTCVQVVVADSGPAERRAPGSVPG